ncbi:MAG: hypothetical protein R3190_13905, partial [Thermoanaerobaculia bacterium]|nr:hypothetical protein [Thermoanaerobaculia bacterium]
MTRAIDARGLAAFVLIFLVLAAAADAQRGASTPVELSLVAEARVLQADIRADVDGLLFGVAGLGGLADRVGRFEALRAAGPEATAEAIDRLAEMVRRRVRIRFDGVRADVDVAFPERRDGEDGLHRGLNLDDYAGLG